MKADGSLTYKSPITPINTPIKIDLNTPIALFTYEVWSEYVYNACTLGFLRYFLMWAGIAQSV